MGAKFYFTSRIDGFVRLFIGLPLMLGIIFSIGSGLNEVIDKFLNIEGNPRELIVGLGGIAIGVGIYIKYVVNYLHFLTSYLQLRLVLGVNVTFKEAKSLAALFVLNEEGAWFPVEEVKKLPKEERKSYLFKFAKKVGRLNWQ